ncbi:protein-tyrosine phosphatase-like protein [Neurospora tetraspora]|uniref:Protein-tyrosine phosphatase-like protein n=1 Tax=Neurospora tetraspora TaxID=94610 RepID=A0AAE0JA35_9PEZI|nr:protein-tyrosine phosphatase-like protein [Neurospora tetraspora]
MQQNAPHTPSPGSLIRESGSITRAAPYDTRPPSPPTVDIPATRAMGRTSVVITPSPRNLDPALFNLDSDYSQIITHGLRPQEALDQASIWEYSARRSAQKVIDPSLYLGPLSVVRDREFMMKEKVTMVVKKDGQGGVPPTVPTLGPAAKKVTEELGIQVEAVGVSGLQELIREFPKLNEKIVRHLVQVHRRSSGSQTGKVLVCCETGNDRSAAVVVAYLIEVWGAGLIEALRFVLYRRFCVAWDDDTRRYLKNYEDILMAKRTGWQDQEANDRDAAAAADERRMNKLKRQLAAVGFYSDDDDDDDEMWDRYKNSSSSSEEASHQARGRNFAPFVERPPRVEGRRNN